MLEADLLRARQLLALQDFYQKSLETHSAVRVLSVIALAFLAAVSVPGWWWALILAGSLLALAIEAQLKTQLRLAFSAKDEMSTADVSRLSRRTVWTIVAITWAYATPYMAFAAAPGPAQVFALIFSIGGLIVIASQHALTRTMASWTSAPIVLMLGLNAAALAGDSWIVFLLLPLLTAANIYVVTGATYTSFVQLIDARLQAQSEAQALDERVRERTRELDAAVQKAEAASTAKSRFLATMSHELRTPLNAVIGYAEIIQEDAKSDRIGSIGLDAARIRAAGLHLLGVINEILDITTIEAGAVTFKPEPFSIRALVEGAVEQVRPAALARGNRIEVTFDGAAGTMVADQGRVRQCLLNLLSNAAKFTSGGSISVRVTDVQLDGRKGVRFAVTDSGIGIAQQDLLALFKPFSQVDNTYSRTAEGSGLGLAITRRLARLMGGDVTVSSEVGRGSTFTLTVAADQRAAQLVA